MIRELTEATDGSTVELVKPATDADVRKMERARSIETGTSFADHEQETDADLEAAGLIEPDTEE